MNKVTGGSRAAKKRAKKKLKEQDQGIEPAKTSQHNNNDIDGVIQPTEIPSRPPKRVKRNKENDTSSTPNKFMHMKVLDFLRPYVSSTDASAITDTSKILTKEHARVFFEFLLSPSHITTQDFDRHYWEKKPLLISKEINLADDDDDNDHDDSLNDDSLVDGDEKKAKQDKYPSRLKDTLKVDPTQTNEYKKRFEGIFSQRDIEGAFNRLNDNDINIVNYSDDGTEKRQFVYSQHPEVISADHNKSKDNNQKPKSRKNVWSHFEKGCTIRLNNPQTFNDTIFAILSLLENEFGCRMESHIDLTPGGITPNQGYAPHYDNTEAFILQLDGCKHWRVYAPRSLAESLPRQPSVDFTEEEMSHMKPVIDVELNPGDLLYIPRGWVHQANTVHGGQNALHISIHTMCNWSWCDFLELLIPDALEACAASESSTLLRKGLPPNFLNYMGVMYEYRDDQDLPEGLKQVAQSLGHNDSPNLSQEEHDKTDEIERLKALQDSFKAEAKKRIMRVCREALDMITAGCDQMAKRFLSERLPPILTQQETQRISEGGKIRAHSMVRCIRKGIARIVLEEGKAILYHCMDNSREFQAQPLSPLEFEVDDGPALEALLTTTDPHWICVRDLNHGMIEDKIEIAQALYDEGLLEVHQG